MASSTFRHQPLNRNEISIRLLEVLPETSSGIVQCKLRHATVESSYTCLSYVWGDSDAQHKILVNNQPFYVRKNLLDFLLIAYKIYPLQPFWIDAISIDQASILERNHQVAHMGQIYSRADKVLIYLGCSRPLVAFIDKWNKRTVPPNDNIIGSLWDILPPAKTPRDKTRLRKECEQLVLNQYWSRAWITQELILANKLSMLAGHLEIDPVEFAKSRSSGDFSHGYGWTPFWQYMDIIEHGYDPTATRLVELLNHLSGRQCQEVRDKVYSILSLVSEGPHMTVDYGISDSVVFEQVVRASEIGMCLCSAYVLATQLRSLSQEPNSCHVKMRLKTNLRPSPMVKVAYHDYYRCKSCPDAMPPAWHPDRGYLFCLHQMCESIHEHLYLSKQHGTVSMVNARWLSSTPNPVQLLKHELDLRQSGDHNCEGFVLTFDIFSEFCRSLKKNKFLSAIRSVPLCESAIQGTTKFKVLSMWWNTRWDSELRALSYTSPPWLSSISASRDWRIGDMHSIDTLINSNHGP